LTTAMVDVQKYSLEFARPYLEASLGAARLGLRQFARADALIRRVARDAIERNSNFLQLNARSLRARLLLSQRRADEALGIVAVDFREAPRDAMYGEYIAVRALALAVSGERKESLKFAAEATAFTRGVEARVLAGAARAVALAGTKQGASACDELLS